MRTFPKTEDGLRKLADKLGVTHDSATTSAGEDRSVMQARILAMLSERRNSNLWIIALISAVASAASAIAVWYLATKC
jgi:cytoskeletal protein RodZ